MSGNRILWGQIIVVFAVVLATTWAATQWTAWRLGFQPQLGPPWFELRGRADLLPAGLLLVVVRLRRLCARRSSSRAPPSPRRGDFIAIAIAIVMSVWRAREAKNVTTYGSARWATRTRRFATPDLLGPDGVVLGRLAGHYLRHDGPEHVLCFAPTRSGKGVGLVVPTLLTWPGAAIVHDIKGENWQLTAGLRSRFGRVLLFDPTNAQVSRLQSAAGGSSRRQGGARCPEHRRHPGRSRRRARTAQSLGEDQPLPARRRHPPCPLRRGGQDARRRRQFPVRSEASDRSDAARDDDDAASRRPAAPGGRLRRARASQQVARTSAPACSRPR